MRGKKREKWSKKEENSTEQCVDQNPREGYYLTSKMQWLLAIEIFQTIWSRTTELTTEITSFQVFQIAVSCDTSKFIVVKG